MILRIRVFVCKQHYIGLLSDRQYAGHHTGVLRTSNPSLRQPAARQQYFAQELLQDLLRDHSLVYGLLSSSCAMWTIGPPPKIAPGSRSPRRL